MGQRWISATSYYHQSNDSQIIILEKSKNRSLRTWYQIFLTIKERQSSISTWNEMIWYLDYYIIRYEYTSYLNWEEILQLSLLTRGHVQSINWLKNAFLKLESNSCQFATDSQGTLCTCSKSFCKLPILTHTMNSSPNRKSKNDRWLEHKYGIASAAVHYGVSSVRPKTLPF